MRIVISKFLTEMSRSKESFSRISAFALGRLVRQAHQEQRVERVHGRHEERLAVPVVGASG